MDQKFITAIKKALEETGMVLVSAEEYSRLELSNYHLQEEVDALELRIKSLLNR